jgi:hypothetical protein
MGPTAESSKGSGARVVGAVYLFYFLTAISGQLLLSRHLAVIGEAINLVSFAAYVAVSLLFYGLFKPVNRTLSLLAAALSLLGCAAGVMNEFHLAPFHPNPLWFFAPYCMLLGWLVLRSTFLPRVIGAILMLAGVAWLAYLSPAVVKAFAHWIQAVGILSEGSLMLWLLVMGVDERRWRERAGVSQAA